ncbi:type IV secretion protein Rhs [Streptomyces xiamenensis]|uniref:Type IV secretion protein Rhs n=1 Tax=Streptomyces xiamenensis TaxID=408015 RepID=A0A0F7FUP5_9ACTN|nr:MULTISPECIES: VgrG-related protein [Streptomyces]AKG43525.1 type IV secretion protein Rhs [Streptomyces xiamenensis]
MAEAAFSSVLSVSIDGTELTKDLENDLIEGWVDQGVGVPAAFRLVFKDPSREILGELGVKFGTKVVITPVADGDGTTDPLFTGEVTGIEADFDGSGSSAIIRGYDSGFRLMRRSRVKAYRGQTASSIAKDLAADNGVQIGQIDATRGEYEFISQSGVTDWDFLARLADENNRVMSIDSRGKFHFVDPEPASGAPAPSGVDDPNPLVLQGGSDVLRLRTAVTAGDQVSRVEARGWNVASKKEVVEQVTNPSTKRFGIGSTPADAAGVFPSVTLVDAGLPYDEQPVVKRAAEALADDVASSFTELELSVHGNPELRPGLPVYLDGVGEPFEGRYTVTSVQHHFGEEPYRTLATVSGRQWRSLYGVASGGGGAQSAGVRLPSVVIALVTDVADPLEQGRVKLKFPWLDDTYISDWCRVTQWGGKGGGGIFPLDVNDEVLVAFDRGAFDHPYVVGGLYNGIDKPTRVKDVPLHDGLKNESARHTLSDRRGNRVDLLSQRPGKNGVRIASGDDRLTIHLDRSETKIIVNSDGAIEIKGDGAVSVEAGKNLTLKAGRKLSLSSGGAMDIKSTGALTIEGLGQVGVKSLGLLNLDAMGLVKVTAGGAVLIKSTLPSLFNKLPFPP